MTTKFLTSPSAGGSLTDGTTNVYVGTLSAANLTSSMAMRTDATGRITTSNLSISDTTNLQTTLDSKVSTSDDITMASTKRLIFQDEDAIDKIMLTTGHTIGYNGSNILFTGDTEIDGVLTVENIEYGGDIGIDAYDEFGDTTLTIENSNATYKCNCQIEGSLVVNNADFGSAYSFSLQSDTTQTWFEILNNGGADKGVFFGILNNDFELWDYQAGAINFYTDTSESSGTLRMSIANDGNIDMSEGLTVDTIDEHTENTGVTIEGVLLKDTGITLVNAIDEFSTDGTLAGDSDTAVPTEKAVKTYVDNSVVSYQKTVTVSPSGGNYTTIQAALTANATSGLLVIVYPGTYSNDTINSTATSQMVVGYSMTGNIIVSNSSSSNIVTSAHSGFTIRNINIIATGSSTEQSIIYMNTAGATIYVDNCLLQSNLTGSTASDDYAMVKVNTGDECRITNCRFISLDSNTLTGGSKIRKMVISDVTTTLSYIYAYAYYSTTADDKIFIHSSVGTIVHHCNIRLYGSTTASHFVRVTGSSDNYDISHNTFIADSGTNSYAYDVDDTSNTLTSRHNNIDFTSITNRYIAVLGSTSTINSYMDFIRAPSGGGSISGTFIMNSSIDDGDFSLSGILTVNTINEYGTGSGVTIDGVLLKDTGITLVNAIDEFSTDGTLAGDSDTAVPTEKAVKTYVDALGVNPEKTFTVSPSGGDYTDIQAALTANSTAGITILVYPGIYGSDTIVSTAANQSIIGMGSRERQMITSTDTNIVSDSYGGLTIKNLTLTYTVSTNAAAKMLTSSSSGNVVRVVNCKMEMTIGAGTGTSPSHMLLYSTAGDIDVENSTLIYTNNWNNTGGISKILIRSISSVATDFRIVNSDITITGTNTTSKAIFLCYAGYAGSTIEISKCRISMTDSSCTGLYGISVDQASQVVDFTYNDVTFTNNSTSTYLLTMSSATSTINSSCNSVNMISSGGSRYVGSLTNGTFNSHMDRIVAPDGFSATGGTHNAIYAPGNGDLTVTSDVRAETSLYVGGVMYFEQASGTIELAGSTSSDSLFVRNSSSTTIFKALADVSLYNQGVAGRTVRVTTGDVLGVDTSRRETKENIEDADTCSWLYNLRVRKFNRKDFDENNQMTKISHHKEIGFVAEEIDELGESAQIACDYNYNQDGSKASLFGIWKDNILGAAVKCIQEQKKIIDKLQTDLIKLTSDFALLQAQYTQHLENLHT